MKNQYINYIYSDNLTLQCTEVDNFACPLKYYALSFYGSKMILDRLNYFGLVPIV